MLPVVIYTLPKLDHGGAELRSLELLGYFTRHYPGLRVIVHSTSFEAGRLDAAFEQAGIAIVRGGSGLKGLLDFYRNCRRHGATVAHINAGMKSGYYVLAAFLAGVEKRYAHFRTGTEDRVGILSRMRGRLGVWLMLLLGTGILGVSAAARHYPGVPPRRWRTIYNGVVSEDPATAVAKRADDSAPIKTLLVLGRIDRNKNSIRAVSVFEALCRRHGPGRVRLCFVGAGREADLARLTARIAASPVADAIAVHQVVDDPLSHLRNATILLLPSSSEGLPGVVLEALAVGTAVVASDIPATREIAEAVAGISLVPLSALDSCWSDAVSRAIHDHDAETIVSAFARGPFLFHRHAAAMAALWGLPPASVSGEARPAVRTCQPEKAGHCPDPLWPDDRDRRDAERPLDDYEEREIHVQVLADPGPDPFDSRERN